MFQDPQDLSTIIHGEVQDPELASRLLDLLAKYEQRKFLESLETRDQTEHHYQQKLTEAVKIIEDLENEVGELKKNQSTNEMSLKYEKHCIDEDDEVILETREFGSTESDDQNYDLHNVSTNFSIPKDQLKILQH